MTTTAYLILFIATILFKDQVKVILQALSGLVTAISTTLVEAMKK